MQVTSQLSFTIKSTLLLALSLILSVACADPQSLDGSSSQTKSFFDEDYTEDSYDSSETDSYWEDEYSWNEGASPWDDELSSESSEQNSSDTLQATHRTQGATAGG